MKGSLGERKKPTRLANKIGVSGENPVNLVNNNVVLIGVRVTAALSAAITAIIVNTGLSPGTNSGAERSHQPHQRRSLAQSHQCYQHDIEETSKSD